MWSLASCQSLVDGPIFMYTWTSVIVLFELYVSEKKWHLIGRRLVRGADRVGRGSER